MAAEVISKTKKSGISWYRRDKKSNQVSVTVISGIKNVTEWFLFFFWDDCPKVAADAILKNIKIKISWIRWVREMNKMSFPAKSWKNKSDRMVFITFLDFIDHKIQDDGPKCQPKLWKTEKQWYVLNKVDQTEKSSANYNQFRPLYGQRLNRSMDVHFGIRHLRLHSFPRNRKKKCNTIQLDISWITSVSKANGVLFSH